MQELSEKTIIVTGASRGIGRGIASALAGNGANVGIHFRDNKAKAECLLSEIEKLGGRGFLLHFDISQPADIRGALFPLFEKGIRISGWVNNAGINLPGLLLNQSTEDIDMTIDVNLKGTIFCCHTILPHMLEHRCGAIVNIGSIVSDKVYSGQAVYAASKAAILAFTKAIAFEYGKKGIRANCVMPGPIDTDMLAGTKHLAGEEIRQRIPMRRIGEPRDIGELVSFLLSERAAYISGAQIAVDGGYSVG